MGIPLSEIPVLSIKKYTAKGPFTIDNNFVGGSDKFGIHPVLEANRLYIGRYSYKLTAQVGAPAASRWQIYDANNNVVAYGLTQVPDGALNVGSWTDLIISFNAGYEFFGFKSGHGPFDMNIQSPFKLDPSKFIFSLSAAAGLGNSYTLANIELDIIDFGVSMLDQF